MRKIKYIMSILFLISTFFSMMTYNYYYMFGHIMEYPFFLVITQWLKISCILLIVLGIYMHNNKATNLLKYISLIIIFQLFYMNSYFDNKFIPNSSDDEIIRNINTLFPIYIIKFLFVFEIVSLFIIGIICNLEDKKLIIKDFIYIPLVMLCVIPLNLFDNIVRILPQSVVQVLKFKNFTIWHLLALVLVFVVPCILYIYLRGKDRKKQNLVLIFILTINMIHYNSKMSVVVGDGYNVYNTIFACIPLFICNIGEFVVSLSIIFKKKFLYHASYFIHAAGAISVFLYFGRDDISNYGTILNYSFLFFVTSHLLLFTLCVLPRMLGHFTINIKDTILPLIYYFIIIILAIIASSYVTSIMKTVTSSTGEHLSYLILPNYSFTQVNPFPVNLPDIYTITLFSYKINVIYILIVYLLYVVAFELFYLLQYVVLKTSRYISFIQK